MTRMRSSSLMRALQHAGEAVEVDRLALRRRRVGDQQIEIVAGQPEIPRQQLAQLGALRLADHAVDRHRVDEQRRERQPRIVGGEMAGRRPRRRAGG